MEKFLSSLLGNGKELKLCTRVYNVYCCFAAHTPKRPHYFAYKERETNLYWLVPCSSKIEKLTVLLFQDMFPVAASYIDGQYIKGGQPVRIADPKLIRELEKNAQKIIDLLHRGVRFTPTQVDVTKIEKIMLEELKKESD